MVTAAYQVMVTNGQRPERELVDRVTGRGGTLVAGAREGTRAVVDAGRDSAGFHRRRVGFDGPVYAVWGECDRLVPIAHRHGVKTAFPHAKIDVWEGMGHHPLRERLDDLLAMIARAAGEEPARSAPGIARAA